MLDKLSTRENRKRRKVELVCGVEMFEGSDVEKNGFKIGQKSPVQTQGGLFRGWERWATLSRNRSLMTSICAKMVKFWLTGKLVGTEAGMLVGLEKVKWNLGKQKRNIGNPLRL